jgi:hypothetical protein
MVDGGAFDAFFIAINQPTSLFIINATTTNLFAPTNQTTMVRGASKRAAALSDDESQASPVSHTVPSFTPLS